MQTFMVKDDSKFHHLVLTSRISTTADASRAKLPVVDGSRVPFEEEEPFLPGSLTNKLNARTCMMVCEQEVDSFLGTGWLTADKVHVSKTQGNMVNFPGEAVYGKRKVAGGNVSVLELPTSSVEDWWLGMGKPSQGVRIYRKVLPGSEMDHIKQLQLKKPPQPPPAPKSDPKLAKRTTGPRGTTIECLDCGKHVVWDGSSSRDRVMAGHKTHCRGKPTKPPATGVKRGRAAADLDDDAGDDAAAEDPDDNDDTFRMDEDKPVKEMQKVAKAAQKKLQTELETEVQKEVQKELTRT